MYIWYSVDKLVFPHCRGDIRYCCYRHWAAGSTLSPPPHFLLLFLHTLTVYCFYHKWCVPNSSTKCMLLTYITHTGLHFTSVLDISESRFAVLISAALNTLSRWLPFSHWSKSTFSLFSTSRNTDLGHELTLAR